MKLFLAILPIVMMIQASMAEPLGRSKRNSEMELVESVVDFFGSYAVTTIKASTHALEKLPKTDAYAPYRKQLEDYVHGIEEGKSKKDVCFKKAFEAVEKFEAFTGAYEKSDAPAEAQEVNKLLLESFEGDVESKFKGMLINFLKAVLFEDTEETTKADIETLKTNLLTTC